MPITDTLMTLRSEIHTHSMDHIQAHPRLGERPGLKGPKWCYMRIMGEYDTHRINTSAEGQNCGSTNMPLFSRVNERVNRGYEVQAMQK